MMAFGNVPTRRIVLRWAVVGMLMAGLPVPPCACEAAPVGPTTGVMLLAQFPNRRGAKDELQPDVFPRPERTLVRQLNNARQLIDRRRFGEAFRCLDVILRSSEDYLFPPDESKPLQLLSLQSEAHRLLGNLGGEGRDLYELQYGSQARQMLDKAVRRRDGELLEEVSRRFFHTAAGAEATFLRGLDNYDHGKPLEAALTLQRLRNETSSADRFEPVLSLALAACWRQAGQPDRANDVLRDLKRRRPNKSVLVAGREQSLATSGPNALPPWLAADIAISSEGDDSRGRWLMPRGNAARTATLRASRPLLIPVWEVPTTDHPLAGTLLAGQSQFQAERGEAMLPSLFPVAVDNVVLVRSLRALTAIDYASGKRLWEVPTDDVLDEPTESNRSSFPQPGQLAALVCQRAWKDGVYGALSSDGRRVFAVEDLGIGPSQGGRPLMIQGGRAVADVWSKSYNRLAAYDVRTGKLVWHVGGSREEFGLPLAGAFFLGEPLPVRDRLYQLAEIEGEIQLYALEASSGEVLWSQRIALVDRNVLQNPVRRSTALSPSHGDDVMVCPTAAGAIVGLKPAQRSLSWGYRYARTPASRYAQAYRSEDGSAASQWTDARLVVVGDRVLATPPDSDEIHCLSLADGRLIWKRPRQGGLYLAGVCDGKVVVVGANRVWAVSLADGKPAWDGRSIRMPDAAAVSGQGFQTGSLYYLPLNSAEVLAIDLDAGEVRRRLASPSGTVPGNLVCCGNGILSQGIRGMAAFYQMDPLGQRIDRRLAENPDDAEALRQKALVLLDSSKRAEAVECLRRSYALSPGARCRAQLRDALLEGLRHEFATYQPAAKEIEKLLDSSADRVRYLCLMAAGFELQKAWKPALEYYLWLANSQGTTHRLLQMGKSHMVRADRWLAARLSEFRESAPGEIVKELDSRLRESLDAARRDRGTEPLERFAECFDGQPLAAEARSELIRRYVTSGELLKAELLLRRRNASGKPRDAAAMMFALAKIFVDAGRGKDAAACYRELEERFGDVVCHDGKTGREVAASLPADSPILAHLHPERVWPGGAVRRAMEQVDPTKPISGLGTTVAFSGGQRPFFVGRVAAMEQGSRALALSDGFGRQEWKLRINGSGTPEYSPQRYPIQLNARGHLLMLCSGNRCVAVDMLGAGQPRVLWDQDVGQAAGGIGLLARQLNAPGAPPVLMVNRLVRTGYGSGVSTPDAFTDEYVCHHEFHRCVALDPLTGQTLWSRSDVPPQGMVLGDGERIFLVPPGATQVTVLRASDGERLSTTRAVPNQQEWIATVGCNILRWYMKDGRRCLELFDPWKQKTAWGPHSFSAAARCNLLDGEAVGVMEPDGHFVLLALRDGETRIDARLEPEPRLEEIILLDSGWGTILVTSGRRPTAAQGQTQWRTFYGVSAKTILQGRVHGFDASGKPLWPDRPRGVAIENQQLLLNQPAWLPVLAFVAQTYAPGVRNVHWMTRVLMIDKRTGREVVNDEYADRIGRINFSGDPATRTVRLDLFEKRLRLTFTDEPIATEKKSPSSPAGAKSSPGIKPSKTLDAVFKALKKRPGE
ncbi:MAG TPA: PQQ-binding-like beta-propeller repeat protein [Thermoguttaceae bacterium]|nr:PQQ-binding-like beta-propeller repeat protein [Thermoguttaceae bacterium]